MKNHTDLLNYIAKKINANHYLEIGVFNPDHNYNKINIPFKVGVDPDPNAKAFVCKTSDEFFEIAKEFRDRFDLIWIDGLHHADQVEKDIRNAWDCLEPGGVIVLHDCNPPTEKTTCVPRGSQREWCGNVFLTISNIQSEKFTIDFDYGCCVIRKAVDPLIINDRKISWEEFDINRINLLNLVSVEDGIKIIDSWD